MISKREKREAKSEGRLLHYLTAKELSVLLRGIKSKYHSDFYCLDYLHSFRTKNKLESHKKVCQNKDFCNIVMLSEETEANIRI